VRAVNRIESRIAEAEKLGFKEIYISRYNAKGLDLSGFKIKVTPVARLDEVVERLMVG
jgi:DNA repair protein RadA/Sms